MGLLTRATIVSEALQLAGDTSLTLRANVWLNNWLASIYPSWAWPFLQGRYGPFTLGVGTTSLTLGNGTNTTDKITSIRRLEIADSSNSGLKDELEIASRDSLEASEDPAWLDIASTGTPLKGIVEVSSDPFAWTIYPSPLPDKTYRLLVVAQRLPAALAADGTIPAYPNDQTMVHAVYCQALRHQKDERFAPESQALDGMVSNDRVKYGKVAGQSTKLLLNKSRFK